MYYYRTNASEQNPIYNQGVASSAATLGPPMNSLNRARSRSPTSYQSMPDSRRSVSPNFPRKNLLPAPLPNRSRSPTPNYTSTFTAKLATNNRNAQQKNSGPASLPIIPSSPTPQKKRQIASINIPVETKVILLLFSFIIFTVFVDTSSISYSIYIRKTNYYFTDFVKLFA